MQELRLNHQIVYVDPKNAVGVSMNLLSFGYRQFTMTARCQKIELFRQLCESVGSNKPEDVVEFGLEQLLDSIKITICFENFMKSLLLLNGYVIHKIDKSVFPELYKQQFERPITFLELKENKEWEINKTIITSEDGLKMQIKGILSNTIGMKELLGTEYKKILNIDEGIFEICKPFFDYRNNLHYYCGESLTIRNTDYSNFIRLVIFINDHVVRIQNQIIDDLGKEEKYKLKKIQWQKI